MELRILCRTQMVRLGRAIASCLKEGDWLFVEGPLGVGKTFLIRGIARGLGVPLEVPIQSPTFALIHEYAARVRIVHVDAYRIGSKEEFIQTGVLDRAEGAVVVAEWALGVAKGLVSDGLLCDLSFEGKKRRAVFCGLGPRGEALLQDLDRALKAEFHHKRLVLGRSFGH